MGIRVDVNRGPKICSEASETVETNFVTVRKGFVIKKDTFCDVAHAGVVGSLIGMKILAMC